MSKAIKNLANEMMVHGIAAVLQAWTDGARTYTRYNSDQMVAAAEVTVARGGRWTVSR